MSKINKIKQILKKIHDAIISIVIFKDPFGPFPEQDNKSKTNSERR